MNQYNKKFFRNILLSYLIFVFSFGIHSPLTLGEIKKITMVYNFFHVNSLTRKQLECHVQ